MGRKSRGMWKKVRLWRNSEQAQENFGRGSPGEKIWEILGIEGSTRMWSESCSESLRWGYQIFRNEIKDISKNFQKIL